MKKLYVPVLALLTLASCSKSELANRPVVENDMVEIMATSRRVRLLKARSLPTTLLLP